MKNYLNIFFRAVTAHTPQARAIPNTVPNSAGGYAFAIDDWARLDRFLILGSEGGSYYAGERVLTRENAAGVLRAIQADGMRVVARAVEISTGGRAPKNDPALFALALAASAEDLATRRAALATLPKVARTGTHLFQFAEFVQGTRGWGRALRRAVGNWYLAQPVDRLAYQLVKYRQRGGWTHRDLLRLAHPETAEPARAALLEWVCRGTDDEALPPLVKAAVALAQTTDADAAAALVREANLPRESVPTELLNHPAVWGALLECMPLTALVRSLAKLTSVGVVLPLGDQLPLVLSALSDAERIAAARLHPLAILLALRTYAQGHGDRGGLAGAGGDRCLERGFLHRLQGCRADGQAAVAGAGRVGVNGGRPRGRIVADAARSNGGDGAVDGGNRGEHSHRRFHGRHGAVASDANDASGRCGACSVGPAVRSHGLCAADALCAGAGHLGRCVRCLHGQRNMGRKHPPGAGTSAVPRADRHRREAGGGRNGVERIQHR